MKSEKTEVDYDKIRGERLQLCRNHKKISQEVFAELINKSSNYVSMLERGKRPINWDRAIQYAKILNVSPAFIMCETDMMYGSSQTTLDLDTFGSCDTLFIKFLMAAGHDIVFHVIKLYDGKQPRKIKALGSTYPDWRSLQIDVTLDSLREFCLSDAHCKLQEADTLSEVIIDEVTLDGQLLKYGRFIYNINRIYDYIHFVMKSLDEFERDCMTQDIRDDLIQDEIEKSRYEHNGIKPSKEERLQKTISDIEEEYGSKSIIIPSRTTKIHNK